MELYQQIEWTANGNLPLVFAARLGFFVFHEDGSLTSTGKVGKFTFFCTEDDPGSKKT